MESDARLNEHLDQLRNDCAKINALFAGLKNDLQTPIDREEELPAGTDKQTRQQISLDQIDNLSNGIKTLYDTVKMASNYTKQEFIEHIETYRSSISDDLYSFLTHHDAYRVFREVQSANYSYDPKLDQEIKSKFQELEGEKDGAPSPNLRGTLRKIARESQSQETDSAAMAK